MQNFSDKRLCELLNRREALKLIKSFTEYNSIKFLPSPRLGINRYDSLVIAYNL